MNTYGQVAYLVLDRLKLNSDDSFWEVNHVVYLINKYRSFLLKQKYSDIRKDIPIQNYQNIVIDLSSTTDDEGALDSIKSSNSNIPAIVNLSNVIGYSMLHPVDNSLYGLNFSMVSRERIRFCGSNKYLSNIVWFAITDSGKLLVKSDSKNSQYLQRVSLSSIFEDPIAAVKYNTPNVDTLNIDIPIEDNLITTIVDMCVYEMMPATIIPEDVENNSSDDRAKQMNVVRK